MSYGQPQRLLDALEKFPKDDQWHQTVPDEINTVDFTTYVRWDTEKNDWRFITTFEDGRDPMAGYVGINETFEEE